MPETESTVEWRYTERIGDVVVKVSIEGDNDLSAQLRDELLSLLIGTYDRIEQEEQDAIRKAAARVHRS